jgi:hypothetical protein
MMLDHGMYYIGVLMLYMAAVQPVKFDVLHGNIL